MGRKSTQDYRTRLSEKLMDPGNFVAVALVFGQFVSDKEFSIIIFMAGLIVMILCYVASYVIIRE